MRLMTERDEVGSKREQGVVERLFHLILPLFL
jgi:hypothetical protein